MCGSGLVKDLLEHGYLSRIMGGSRLRRASLVEASNRNNYIWEEKGRGASLHCNVLKNAILYLICIERDKFQFRFKLLVTVV